MHPLIRILIELAFIAIIVFLCYRYTKRVNEIKRMQEEEEHRQNMYWLEEKKRIHKLSVENERKQFLKKTYADIGEILHSLELYINTKNFKYLPLINELGGKIRNTYTKGKPLEELETYEADPRSSYKFPCLNDDENDRLKGFLTKIINEEDYPEDLLDFICELMNSNDFTDAMNKIEIQIIHRKKKASEEA